MRRLNWRILGLCLALTGAGSSILVWAFLVPDSQAIQILRAKPDPYGYPRPSPNEKNVPVGTSFFFMLGFNDKDAKDSVLAGSITVEIGPRGGSPVEVLRSGLQFADGYRGKVFPTGGQGQAVAVYIDSSKALRPSTTYVISVSARSKNGAVLKGPEGAWEFATEDPAEKHSLKYELDLSRPPVGWHGGFFTGFCKTGFCTSAGDRIPGYLLMERVRNRYPKSWSLERDFYLTGMERQPKLLSGGLPNLVRERETRRVVAMQKREKGILLRTEDFFGHEQYGIPSGRRLSEDYHPGDEVMIADGVNHAEAKVLAVAEDDPAAGGLLVTPFETPVAGWKIEYAGPLPEKENPNAPGLFPPGGCYLMKFRPAGTPHYYWGRLDKEWDIAVLRFNRRLVVGFGEAPGDLSVDGEDWTYPKDYVEYHEVVRKITEHLIDRYGKACLDFYWSVFNEPDLAGLFWRSGNWNELQKSYDYTVDAILRAFEDRGYDSKRVMVGGLEIGGIFGANIREPILEKFLRHCSPAAIRKEALSRNAAFADTRLDGKRSRRVEELCRKHGGQGSPCDFLSVHAYNASRLAAEKIIRAKEIALEVDKEYYGSLWVDSFESCPNWSPPPDVAASDSYLGNGYFSTWCADIARRLLARAAEDGRFSFGETILTFWSWPGSNFAGQNDATTVVRIDENGDGRMDRSETVALPILNFLGLLSAMGDDYWVLPEKIIGGHVLSGFISRSKDAIRVLLYSHNEFDTQSRSTESFEFALDLGAAPWPKVRLKEYAFDKDHNSCYRLAVHLRDRPDGVQKLRRPDPEDIRRVISGMLGGDADAQLSAIKEAASFGDIPDEVVSTAVAVSDATNHPEVRSACIGLVMLKQDRRPSYSPEEVRKVRELSELTITKESILTADRDSRLRFTAGVEANGARIIVIEPAEIP